MATALALVLALAGCTYSHDEPGLFSPVDAPSSSAPPQRPARSLPPPAPTNPALPVAGEAVWTTGEGLRVQVRIAVHAVRRVAGATVLDWSVTPLQAPGRSWGDPVPDFLDLGLSRSAPANLDVFLLDPVTGRVYRPLSHESRREFNRCLCSPLWVAQLDLRIGETRMLQATYPQLPSSLAFVDVDMVTLPPFDHVPVTPLGEVPTARRATDLSRQAAPEPELMAPLTFRSVPGQPQLIQSIVVDRIVAGPDRTSVEWTLGSVTSQPNFNVLPFDPPVSARLPPDVYASGSGAASGPEIRVSGSDGPPVEAQWMTDSFTHEGLRECLCTSLGLWAASLRVAGGAATVTTNYPALPADVTRVDLVLPGAGQVRGLPVTRAVDSAANTGAPVAATSGSWTYDVEKPPDGWSTSEWPTPLPAAGQLRHFLSTVDHLVALPPR